MKNGLQFLTFCMVALLLSCTKTDQTPEPRELILKDGSAEILHDITVANFEHGLAIAQRKIRFKKDVDQNALMADVKRGKVDFSDKKSVVSFYNRFSSTPEAYASYVNELILKGQQLALLNKELFASNADVYEAQLNLELNNQSKEVQLEQVALQPPVDEKQTLNGGLAQSFHGPNGDWNDYQVLTFGGSTPESLQGHGDVPMSGGGGPDPVAFGFCIRNADIAFGSYLDNFSLKMLIIGASGYVIGVAPLTAPVVGALDLILFGEAILENYMCKERVGQTFDSCANQAGYYRRKTNA